MTDIGGFSKRMKIRAKQLDKNMNKAVREVALIADREVVLQTPVDTGRARSNWIVSLGSPSREQQDAYTPGQGGSTGADNARAALEQAAAEISRRQPGQDINISNNLPYIGRLNEGYSAQAPAGFVQAAVLRAVNALKNLRVFDGN